MQLGFFPSYGRGTQKRTQSQKNGSGNHKNDTKAAITLVYQQLRPKFFRDKLDRMEGLPKKWC